MWAVRRLNPDFADFPAIPVSLGAIGKSLLTMRHAGQVLSGAITEGLGLLGCINPGNPDSMLSFVSVEEGQSVAVLDVYDTTR